MRLNLSVLWFVCLLVVCWVFNTLLVMNRSNHDDSEQIAAENFGAALSFEGAEFPFV